MNTSPTAIVLSESSITTYLREAEDNIVKAFQTLKKVEQEGIDVFELAAELNRAIELLADANYFYTHGEVPDAISQTSSSIEISVSVQRKAENLFEVLVKKAETKSRNEYISTRLIIIILILSLLISWKKFKQYYLKKSLNKKPMVL